MNKTSEYVVAIIVLLALIVAIVSMVLNNKVYEIAAAVIAVIAVLYSIYLIHSDMNSVSDTVTDENQYEQNSPNMSYNYDTESAATPEEDSEVVSSNNRKASSNYTYSTSENSEDSNTVSKSDDSDDETQSWLSDSKQSSDLNDDVSEVNSANIEKFAIISDTLEDLQQKIIDVKKTIDELKYENQLNNTRDDVSSSTYSESSVEKTGKRNPSKKSISKTTTTSRRTRHSTE